MIDLKEIKPASGKYLDNIGLTYGCKRWFLEPRWFYRKRLIKHVFKYIKTGKQKP